MNEISSIIDPKQQSKVTIYTQELASSNTPNIAKDAQIWSLYFDGSKSREGVGVGCVLINPTGNKKFIAFRLYFECTNNKAEYNALM